MAPGLDFGFGGEGAVPHLDQRFQYRHARRNGGRFQLFQHSGRHFAQILIAYSSRRGFDGLGRGPRRPLCGRGRCLVQPMGFPRQHLLSPKLARKIKFRSIDTKGKEASSIQFQKNRYPYFPSFGELNYVVKGGRRLAWTCGPGLRVSNLQVTGRVGGPVISLSAGLRQQYTRTGGTLSSSSSISGCPSNSRPMSATCSRN